MVKVTTVMLDEGTTFESELWLTRLILKAVINKLDLDPRLIGKLAQIVDQSFLSNVNNE